MRRLFVISLLALLAVRTSACELLSKLAAGADSAATWGKVYEAYLDVGLELDQVEPEMAQALRENPLWSPPGGWPSSEFRELRAAIAASLERIPSNDREAALAEARMLVQQRLDPFLAIPDISKTSRVSAFAEQKPTDAFSPSGDPVGMARALNTLDGYFHFQRGILDPDGNSVVSPPKVGWFKRELQFKPHTGPVRLVPDAVQYNPQSDDGKTFLGFSRFGHGYLWTPDKDRLVSLRGSPLKRDFVPLFLQPVKHPIEWKLSEDGRVALVVSQHLRDCMHATAYDAQTGKRLGTRSFRSFEGKSFSTMFLTGWRIQSSTLSDDGKVAFFVNEAHDPSGRFPIDRVVRWELVSGKTTRFDVQGQGSGAASQSLDGNRFLAGLKDRETGQNTVVEIDFATQSVKPKFPVLEPRVKIDLARGWAIGYVPGGHVLRFYSLADGKPLAMGRPPRPLQDVRVAADGKKLIIEAEGKAAAFDIDEWFRQGDVSFDLP